MRQRNVLIIKGNGAPGGTRTPDLLVRSQTLYPTELRAHGEDLMLAQRCEIFLLATGRRGSTESAAGKMLRTAYWRSEPGLRRDALGLYHDWTSCQLRSGEILTNTYTCFLGRLPWSIYGKRTEFSRQPKKLSTRHVRRFGAHSREPRSIREGCHRDGRAALRKVHQPNPNACGAARTRVQHTGILDRQALT